MTRITCPMAKGFLYFLRIGRRERGRFGKGDVGGNHTIHHACTKHINYFNGLYGVDGTSMIETYGGRHASAFATNSKILGAINGQYLGQYPGPGSRVLPSAADRQPHRNPTNSVGNSAAGWLVPSIENCSQLALLSRVGCPASAGQEVDVALAGAGPPLPRLGRIHPPHLPGTKLSPGLKWQEPRLATSRPDETRRNPPSRPANLDKRQLTHGQKEP